MKTSELQGAALDWAVAKCEDSFHEYMEYDLPLRYLNADGGFTPWNPSTNWAQGGPIIEREGICLYSMDAVAPWDARLYDGESEPWHAVGDTPLIAAMRCYCCAKLGNEVEIPEELK